MTIISNPYGRDADVPDRDLPPGTVTSVESLEYLAPIKPIAWGAVFAGVVLAIGIQVLLNMLGAGIGASTIDPLRGNTPDAQVLGIWAAVWWILSSLIALFVGGWTAARLAGISRQVDGMLHGFLAWALSTLVVFYFLGTVVGGLIGGTFNLISGGVAAVAPQVADAVASEADISWKNIKQEARQLLRSGGATSDQEIDSLLGRLIRKGKAVASGVDREEVVAGLMARTDMSREEAKRTVDNWITTYGRATAEANQQARQVADTTADAVAKASIWGFLALLIGAAAAGFGGVMGTPRTPVVAQPPIAP